MPPKNSGASKKAEQKKKEKIVEDKTFGLKNKNKSKAVQKYVTAVQQQVTGKQQKAENMKRAEEKAAEERAKMERDLYKPVVAQQKVPVGVDPKSIVCEFFKKGQCTKGDKCKFSHDLQVGRKTEKIDLYTDARNAEDEEKKADVMDNWSQEKLETVVESKRTDVNRNLKTKIVCKFFIDAVETKKYGWFWECPSGPTCIYQHCLPPGFVLKDRAKKDDEEEEEDEGPTIEEQIEEERKQLTTRTPLTLDIFLKWKEEKKAQKEAASLEAAHKREQDIRAGKIMRSGREMFTYDPSLFVDDEGAIDASELLPDESDEPEGPILRLDMTGTSISYTRVNRDGTVVFQPRDVRPDDPRPPPPEEESSSSSSSSAPNGASAAEAAEEPASGEGSEAVDGVALDIQENLFVEDDIPDDDDDEDDGDA
eukprot:TRINITY_DN3690_c0_g1_i1.p1 TRINITY_DN3690_c0_g1~~TRINITY_DN3690_c0_g1_i1.p1  ORF type:complete len:423 (+),score=165.59 TRINITY_DN3690_c0_g1_i1:61-1329(+)